MDVSLLTRIRFTQGISLMALFISVGFSWNEESHPQGYFSMPVNRTVLLSGTFGELRSNHFHAGLDIKSKDGSVGEPLIAAGPGYISRISVQSGGYGNVLYLDHPNGYTTVYAHMDRFTPEVAAYVKTMQYAQERFAVDLSVPANQFSFEKGQLIGYLGNSGSSTGPHVHFEIRKTADQLPINPLLFGLTVEDNAYPGIRSLKVFHLDDELHEIADNVYSVQSLGPGRYKLSDTLTENALRVGFALKVYDQMTGASNQNGIYGLSVAVDDAQQYRFALNSIPFSLTRYLNAHIDYAARRFSGGFFHRCYKLPGNALDIYEEDHERGIVSLSADSVRKVEIKAFDFGGNSSSLTFYIRGDVAPEPIPESNHDYTMDYLQSGRIHTPEMLVSFEPHTFYQNARLNVTKSEVIRRGLYAYTHTIAPSTFPVHRYYDMTLQSVGLPEHLKSKAFIARIAEDGSIINCGGAVHGEYVVSRVRSLGAFSIAVDTIAPEIIPITFRSNMAGSAKMQFRIGDNQATEGQASSIFYHATVDGKWILMEYDGKRSMLTHWFDDRIGPGPHELQLTVRDDRGNVATLNRTFSR